MLWPLNLKIIWLLGCWLILASTDPAYIFHLTLLKNENLVELQYSGNTPTRQ